MIDPDVQAACEEYSLRIVPPNVVPAIGETRAPDTLRRIKEKYGRDHMRFVVGLLTETENNRNALTSDILWATSDVVRAFKKNYPAIYNDDVEKMYAFFDGLPIAWLYFECFLPLEGITSKRKALVGGIWERAVRRFGAISEQPDMFDDRGTA